ncbi:hypothetical protein FRC17_008766 [Serendipita sp. 399]|nr:hypothetical protein FRC17_008766 [Serendipita sp. 399]
MSSRSRQVQLAEDDQPGPRQWNTRDAHLAASANQASSSGTNVPNWDQNQQDAESLNRKASTIGARYDQPALAPSTVGGSSLQLSHDHTTVYSGSTYDSQDPHGRRSRRDNDDMASVYSYNSTRDVREFVKEMHGRIFNRLNDAYLLPSDDEEWSRLDKQHSAITIAMGGLYPCQEDVEAVLSPVDGIERKILDLGCGTGSWAIEMANRFPHCTVLGVDIAPTPLDTSCFPPNLSFEIDDINLGLAHFKDSFDLIHMRCVMGGIKDMRKTLEEVQACLKPGGMLVIIDGDYRLYKDVNTIYPLAKLPEDKDVSGVSENGSWMSRVVWEACEACNIAGSNIDNSKEVVERGLWSYSLLDPKTAMGGHFFFPLGPWATSDDLNQTQTLRYVGVLMRQNFLNIHRAYHAILRKHGMQQGVLDDWSKLVDEELGKTKHKVWVRFVFCCARRRAGPDEPAPPLPASSPTSEPVIVSSLPPYATYEEWRTEERALVERERRIRTIGDLPQSVVRAAYASMNRSKET